MSAIAKLNQAVHFLTDFTAPQLQPNYTLTSLPLTARVLSPKCLKNPFFLWAHRIVSLPFLLVTFLLDSTLGNLYRLTFSNHQINILNQKLVQENQQKNIHRIYKVAGAIALFMIAYYCLKNTATPPGDDGVVHSIFTSHPNLINGAVFLGSAGLAITNRSPSYFVGGMTFLALWNKHLTSPFSFYLPIPTSIPNSIPNLLNLWEDKKAICRTASVLHPLLRPLNHLTHSFEMKSSLGILFPLAISFPMIFKKIGEWAGFWKPTTPADPAAQDAKPTSQKQSDSLIPSVSSFVRCSIQSLLPLLMNKTIASTLTLWDLLKVSGHTLVLIPFNQIADNLTQSVEKKETSIRVATYALSAFYAIANAALMYNTVTSCHTGFEIILSLGCALSTQWAISKGLEMIPFLNEKKA